MEEEVDNDMITDDHKRAYYEQIKPRAMTSCYGRGLPRLPLIQMPDFSNIEMFEKSNEKEEFGASGKGRGRGRARSRGASTIGIKTRIAADINLKRIQEESRSILGNNCDPVTAGRKAVRTPRTNSIVGSGFLTGSTSNGMSSSSSVMPEVNSLSSSRSGSVSSSLASSHGVEPIPLQADEASGPNQLPEPTSVCSFSSTSINRITNHSGSNGDKSSFASDLSEGVGPPDNVPSKDINIVFEPQNNSVQVEMSPVKPQNHGHPVDCSDSPAAASQSSTASNVTFRRAATNKSAQSSDEDKGGKAENVTNAALSDASDSATCVKTTNNFDIKKCQSADTTVQSKMSVCQKKKKENIYNDKRYQRMFEPNIVESSDSNEEEGSYHGPRVCPQESEPKWEPFKPKGPDTWVADDFPLLAPSTKQDKTSDTSKAVCKEEVSFKSIASSLQNKNILEPVSNSDKSNSASTDNDIGLLEFLNNMTDMRLDQEVFSEKPETILMSDIPPNVTVKEIREILDQYSATVTEVKHKQKDGTQQAKITVQNCDGSYLVEVLNDTDPFGGGYHIKCKLL